jgi:eukaryotic-like serine/threonine-protein kinase
MAGPGATQRAADWAREEAALDALIALPPEQRAAAIERLAAGDADFQAALTELAAGLDDPDPLLDAPLVERLRRPVAAMAATGLGSGTRLGPWRIVAPIGRGGMGEVYAAERADGQFDQRVAIKLMRPDMAPLLARFQVERQIVARLDHPGIAHLIDGAITADGRPYMVMELVEGVSLAEWGADRGHTLEQRLALFSEICAAVAHAHRNLVVHRDIKPANVRVTAEGRPKLLDFGIARLLDGPAGEPTRELRLTPGYAAPEQFGAGPVTTAADVYALGLLLHELLCGRPAHAVDSLPLAAAMQQVLQQAPAAPSQMAREQAAPPLPATVLQGDLDAIVAMALRKEPEQRYASVDALADDVERHRLHRPVRARRGTWLYVVGRALRRQRAAAAVAALALLLLIGGAGVVAWQARVARAEAGRANAVKAFLLQVFAASDPRIASDKPRGQVTARELLDAAAARIDAEFKDQPALRIELLGTVARIYRELGEPKRYHDLQTRELALAQQYPGRFVSTEVEVWLDRAGDAADDLDYALSRRHLQLADRLLTQAGLDHSVLRALWWVGTGQAEDRARFDAREAAFRKALALFQRYGPRDAGRATALSELGLAEYDQGRNEAAVDWYRQALAAHDIAEHPDDGEAQTIWGNMGEALLNLGRYDEAAGAYRQAAAMALRTYGERHPDYWSPAAQRAQVLHLNGQRDEAMRQFRDLLTVMPAGPTRFESAEALIAYGDCLLRQGEAAAALPVLEAVARWQQNMPPGSNALRRMHLRLGDVYEQLGRGAEARRLLETAYAEYAAAEAPDRQTRMAATERWARFLVAHDEPAPAKALFAAVLAQDHGRHYAHAALAQAGMARVALAGGDVAAAMTASQAARDDWAAVRGFRDVRMGVYIDRVRAQVLLAAGDNAGAQTLAESALAASLHYDVATAPSVAEAQSLLQQAKR